MSPLNGTELPKISVNEEVRVGAKTCPDETAVQYEIGLLVIILHSTEVDKAAVGMRGDVRVRMRPQHKIVNSASFDYVG